jgi:hypothetical protein
MPTIRPRGSLRSTSSAAFIRSFHLAPAAARQNPGRAETAAFPRGGAGTDRVGAVNEDLSFEFARNPLEDFFIGLERCREEDDVGACYRIPWMRGLESGVSRTSSTVAIRSGIAGRKCYPMSQPLEVIRERSAYLAVSKKDDIHDLPHVRFFKRFRSESRPAVQPICVIGSPLNAGQPPASGPSASITSRAAAVPEHCRCPVLEILLSRIAPKQKLSNLTRIAWGIRSLPARLAETQRRRTLGNDSRSRIGRITS